MAIISFDEIYSAVLGESHQISGVENAFGPGEYCARRYADMTAHRQRLWERLGWEDDEDIDNITEEQISSVQIYPNPVNDRIFIEAETEIEEVVVYDIYGRHQVTETPSHQGDLSIDLSDLKSGIYFVKINTEKGNIVKRIIKD